MRKVLYGLVAAVMVLGVSAGSARAGLRSGPTINVHAVAAKDSMEFKLTFKAGEVAAVMVVGDGSTDLDVFIYDERGVEIASDVNTNDRILLTWKPARQQQYTIKVKNLGRVLNRYTLAIN